MASGCVVRPELTAGPYFVEEGLNRSDIRSDPASGEVSAGTPLDLSFHVSRIAENACVPLADPRVDTRGRKFLRGHQVTDADGISRFATIYPGWYPGRAVHVHFKVRSAPEAVTGFDFTSQLFFDETLTDRVHAAQPYASNGLRDRRNSDDGIFRQRGAELMQVLEPAEAGYRGIFEIALQGV